MGIALYVRDRFVRPYLGDVLAVMLVYCALRAVVPLRPMTAATIAFGVGAAVELGQWVGILDLLGLRGNTVARVVLGSGFEAKDFLAYAAGAAIMLALDGREPPERSEHSR